VQAFGLVSMSDQEGRTCLGRRAPVPGMASIVQREASMLTIYGVYRSRASRNIWLANELGLPFKHVPIIQAYRLASPEASDAPEHTKSPSFLAVNPNGQIPAIDHDGVVLTESLAINHYLAKMHGGPLAPATVAEDGQMTMWTLRAAAEIEPHSIQVYYHRLGKPPAERDEKLAQASIDALKPKFAVLDKHLAAHGGHLVGGRFTLVDINVAEVVRYAMPAKDLFAASPAVTAWLAACHARPAFKSMMAKREAEPA
jgi:glutathione S-transferase